jgi:hypothetical protein
MARFLQLTIKLDTTPLDPAQVEKILDSQAVDWLRYAPNCWVLYTSDTATVWRDRFLEKLGKGCSIFLFNIDMSQWAVWSSEFTRNWLTRKR